MATNRRNFLTKTAAAGAAAAAVAPAAKAQSTPTKKVHYGKAGKPDKPGLFNSAVSYGNLLFIAGKGAHVPGDIKSHTKIVLDTIESELTKSGSSMDKVLKCTVYLSDAKDYAGMNEVFKGRFGDEPPVRTTVAAAWIPGNSLVEIDVIAYI